MKIAFVTTWDVKCGIASYTKRLKDALEGLGHTVEIVKNTRERDKGKDFWDSLYEATPEDIDVLHIQHENGLFWGGKAPYYYDLLQDRDYTLITTLHTSKPMNELAFSESDWCVVHNRFSKTHFEYPCAIIPHGVEIYDSLTQEEAKEELGYTGETLIGVPGYIVQPKKVERFIKALEYIDEDIKPLLVGGQHPEGRYQEYRDMIEEIKPDSLTITGHLPSDEYKKYLKALDVGIHTSSLVWESGVIADLLGAGTVGIAKDVPPNLEKDCIDHFTTPKDLAKKITRLLNDSDYYNRKKEQVLEYREENSWEEVAKEHIELYEMFQ